MATLGPVGAKQFNPLARLVQSGVNPQTADQSLGMMRELGSHFLTQNAKVSVIPVLERLTAQTLRASNDPKLSPENLSNVYRGSAKAMQVGKRFLLRADETALSPKNETFVTIKTKINLLSITTTNLGSDSVGFNAAINQIADQEVSDKIEASMAQYNRRAEKTLGVANLDEAEVEATSKKVEALLTDPSVTSERVEETLEAAASISTTIAGAMKAIESKKILPTKAVEGKFASRLQNLANASRRRLNQATRQINEIGASELQTIIKESEAIQDSIADIKDNELAINDINTKNTAFLNEMKGYSPEAKKLIETAQLINNHKDVPQGIKDQLNSSLKRSLKLASTNLDAKNIDPTAIGRTLVEFYIDFLSLSEAMYIYVKNKGDSCLAELNKIDPSLKGTALMARKSKIILDFYHTFVSINKDPVSNKLTATLVFSPYFSLNDQLYKKFENEQCVRETITAEAKDATLKINKRVYEALDSIITELFPKLNELDPNFGQ